MSNKISRGVNFHTSANAHFGRPTKPTSIPVHAHSRAPAVPVASGGGRGMLGKALGHAIGQRGAPSPAAAPIKAPAAPLVKLAQAPVGAYKRGGPVCTPASAKAPVSSPRKATGSVPGK